ncbi:hypothetical protein B9G39_29315 [Zooshikella ganghwensis]|uniref:Uncharacterized protein n=2 Tax=Zooshikella ganghwensis TaxID=202772 RepID=A0A4P9VIA8_9GAMM|nr:hypothetical protein B9G39_29160 [Zooshikella ganghwensis]RDH41372.1 hypothetical protein B9G39_29315 [Zooshikella ganghwensis]
MDQFGGKSPVSWINLVANPQSHGSIWWQIPSLMDQFGGKSPASWSNLVGNFKFRGSVWWQIPSSWINLVVKPVVHGAIW